MTSFFRHLRVLVVLFLTCAALTLPTSLSAQSAFGVPTGDRIVEADLEYLGKRAHVEVREGELIRIRFQGGYAYVLQPHVSEEGQDQVEFVIYELATTQEGAEQVREIQRVRVAPGLAGVAATKPPIDIRLAGIRVGVFPSVAPEDPSELDPGTLRRIFGESSTCCSFCDGVSICACAVQTSCGSCCSDSCCDDDGEPSLFEMGT